MTNDFWPNEKWPITPSCVQNAIYYTIKYTQFSLVTIILLLPLQIFVVTVNVGGSKLKQARKEKCSKLVSNSNMAKSYIIIIIPYMEQWNKLQCIKEVKKTFWWSFFDFDALHFSSSLVCWVILIIILLLYNNNRWKNERKRLNKLKAIAYHL